VVLTHEFLARMSHELRTPLTAILGFGELLQLTDLDERTLEWVGMIVRASEHLLELVNDVVELSTVDSDALALAIAPVPIDSLLLEVHELLTPMAQTREVVLHLPAPAGGGVLADAQRLKQVITNLVSNAIKYNRAGGEVRIIVGPAGSDLVRISVEDTGRGIPTAALEKVFVPFERLDARSNGVDGTGLGLPLARRLVHVMHGTLGVESTQGEGSRFWVELPAARSA
jgi:signal transduction histidine kinase